MLKALFVSFFAFLISPILSVYADMLPLANHGKPTLAIFSARWCGNCQILEPKLMKALDQLQDKSVLNVVKFDFTNDASEAKSAGIAGYEGLTDLYNAYVPKTGFVILVDSGDEGQSPVMLTKKDSVEEMRVKLESFIASKSGS